MSAVNSCSETALNLVFWPLPMLRLRWLVSNLRSDGWAGWSRPWPNWRRDCAAGAQAHVSVWRVDLGPSADVLFWFFCRRKEP